jgi:hypothetical protein
MWTRLDDGTRTLTCVDCGRVVSLDLRDRPSPVPVGTYNEAKAVAGRAKAEKTDRDRRSLAAERSVPHWNVRRSSVPRRADVIDLRRRAR